MQHTEQLVMGTVSGSKYGRRYVPVHDLCSSLSNITCHILLSLYGLTGCDTISAFFRIGKQCVYTILKTSLEELSELVSLINADLESTINAARYAVSLLYDPKGKLKSCHHDLGMLRVKLATIKDAFLSRIPPSEPSFKQHVLRSSLHTTVLMTSHLAKPPVRSPLDYGWQKGNNGLESVLCSGIKSSDFLQDLI